MPAICESYCSHGGHCILDPGHPGKHDSRYCTWTDEEGVTSAEADAILLTKPGGEDYLRDVQPLADLLEAIYDGLDESEE